MARKTSAQKPVGDAPVTVGSDPEGAAARIMSDGEGAGAEGSPRSSSTERVRRHREKKKAQDEPESTVIEVDEGDIAEAKTLGITVWELAMVPALKMKPLTDEQGERLGKSLAPVLKKYLPMLGGWVYEASLLLTLTSLVVENRQPKQEKEPDPVPTSVATFTPSEN